jgi:predicted metal-dependent hydrolase
MSPFMFSGQPEEAKTEDEKPQIEFTKPETENFELNAARLIKNSGDWFDRRLRNIDEATEDPYKNAIKIFLDIFAKQGIAIIKKVNRITKAIDLEDDKKIQAEIARALKQITDSHKKDYSDNYKANFEKMASTTFDHPYYAGDQETVQKISSGVKTELSKFIDKRYEWLSTQINATTSRKMFDIIKEAGQSSDTITEMTRKISKFFSDEGQMLGRAETIARTETLTVLSQSQDEATKKASKVFPDLKKMWVSTFDDRTRGNPGGLYKKAKADHWGLHGQIKKIDESFIDPRNKDNLKYPRDPRGKPESVINCRCTYITLPAKEMEDFVSTESEARPND